MFLYLSSTYMLRRLFLVESKTKFMIVALVIGGFPVFKDYTFLLVKARSQKI